MEEKAPSNLKSTHEQQLNWNISRVTAVGHHHVSSPVSAPRILQTTVRTSCRTTNRPFQPKMGTSWAKNTFAKQPLICVSFSSYRALSKNARLGFGVGLMAWGFIGLTWSDSVGEKLGIIPDEKEKKDLERLKPSITVVERGQ